MMSKSSSDPELPIAPALYQETLERLDLQSIRLDCIEASCDRESFDQGGMSLNLATQAEDSQDAGHYSIFITYTLEGRREEQVCLSIKTTYRLVFRTTDPVPTGFFEVFQELNLRMLTLPYFREFIASLTSRMELPTLTIPLDVFATHQDEEPALQEKVKRPHKRAARVSKGREGA